jgi:formate dehydrogenase maturation protein FdhE
MDDLKCSMCHSTWHIDYKEHAFYPNKKTCKECTNRSAMIRLEKKRDKIEKMIDEIMLLLDTEYKDEDYINFRIYSINNFKCVLYKYHNVKATHD